MADYVLAGSFFDRIFTRVEMVEALASLFGAGPGEILVTKSIADYEGGLPAGVRVLCETCLSEASCLLRAGKRRILCKVPILC
ncbi:MAG: hypothetical protein RDV48_20295 [Candidatus Eremiobacteraeota bacterium]|nr:hypothetical protein [Candidatus Eremiobacteraeota bacterium]